MDFTYSFIDKYELSNDYLPDIILDTKQKKDRGNTDPPFLPLMCKML